MRGLVRHLLLSMGVVPCLVLQYISRGRCGRTSFDIQVRCCGDDARGAQVTEGPSHNPQSGIQSSNNHGGGEIGDRCKNLGVSFLLKLVDS